MPLPANAKRPLILGASVSSEFNGTKSPGRYLSEDAGIEPRVQAHIGNRGSLSQLLPNLKDEDLDDTDIIYSLDSLFWDSWRKDPNKGLIALNDLLNRTQKRKIPVVLGNVPEIDVAWLLRVIAGAEENKQYSRDAINKGIKEACTLDKQCHLVDLDNLYKETRDTGGYNIGDTRYSFEQLMPDGLHPSDIVNRELANRIKRQLNGN